MKTSCGEVLRSAWYHNWCLLALLMLSQAAVARDVPPAPRPSGAAIASAHRLATDAGHDILARGGNAFDAAVAVSAMLSVVEPVSSGLGGGGFFLLHQADTGREIMVDARETAPASTTAEKYLDAKGELDRDKAINGPLSAGIPGLPAGLVHLAEKYGRLPLAESLRPAIHVADGGFQVYPRLQDFYVDRREVMERFAGTRAVFLADGDPPKSGEMLRQPDLARTLTLLGKRGLAGFYRGEVAHRLLADVRKYGGDWTAKDLSGYRVVEREPIRFQYRQWSIVTAPPPSSGGVALAQTLQILEGWDLAALPEPQRIHLVVEAERRAFRDRTVYLGDPDFFRMPIARLISDDYAAGLRAGIHPQRATPSDMLPAGASPREHVNTSHFSIIDKAGNYVAATQSVNLPYGSGMVVEGTGVLLNDEMDDFALKAGTLNAFEVSGYAANAVAPGKRMLSSMTPTFMIGKDSVAVLGAKGGSRIITAVLLGILGIEQGLSSQEIVDLPRYHQQYLPDVIFHEPGAFSEATTAALQAMGHELRSSTLPIVLTYSVDWDRRANVLGAGSDARNPVGSARVESAAAGIGRETEKQ